MTSNLASRERPNSLSRTLSVQHNSSIENFEEGENVGGVWEKNDALKKNLFCSVFEEHFSTMESVDTSHFCNCCGFQGNFSLFNHRHHAMCPKCKALERHRVACLNLAKFSLLEPQGKVRRVLHFGPQRAMFQGVEKVCPEARVDHIPVDFFAPGYENKYSPGTLHANAESLLFPNKSISLILCFHVLEHVRRLDQAFEEFHRVLVVGGKLLVEVPCSQNSRKTRDCRMFSTEAELTKCAGQNNHVWWFSCAAFKEKVKEVGFSCEDTNSRSPVHLSPHPQYLCTKIAPRDTL